jgi:hypothetical protein
MRVLVAFKHFWSLFWSLLVTFLVTLGHFFLSLLVTQIHSLYERVDCFQTLLVTLGHFSGHFWSQKHRLCMRVLVAFRRGALLVTFLVTFGHTKHRLCMRGLVAFKHYRSLFWSLLVTRIQALYERVGCFQTLLVTFLVTFGHTKIGSV